MFGTHGFDLLSESFNDLPRIERLILHLVGLCGLYASGRRLPGCGFPVTELRSVWNYIDHSQEDVAFPQVFRWPERAQRTAPHYAVHVGMRE